MTEGRSDSMAASLAHRRARAAAAAAIDERLAPAAEAYDAFVAAADLKPEHDNVEWMMAAVLGLMSGTQKRTAFEAGVRLFIREHGGLPSAEVAVTYPLAHKVDRRLFTTAAEAAVRVYAWHPSRSGRLLQDMHARLLADLGHLAPLVGRDPPMSVFTSAFDRTFDTKKAFAPTTVSTITPPTPMSVAR